MIEHDQLLLIYVYFDLFPVSILMFRRCRESNPLVTMAELYCEVCHQGVEIVVPFEGQVEGAAEGDVLLLDCLDVNLLDQTVGGHQTLVVHAVHQGLRHGHLPDAGHVEAVDVVPPVDLVVLVLSVLDTADVEVGSVREHEAALSQPLVPGEEDGVQHGLVEQAVAHPLGDDDVNLGHGQLDLLHLAPDDGDSVTETVVCHNLLGVVHDGAHVHPDDLGGPGLGCKHGEDASTASHVQHNLVFEQVLVVPH